MIFAIKTSDMTFCICARPASKLDLIQKIEKYLSIKKLKSGIDMSKGNFPDKKWLVQAIATLSLGSEKTFDPNYMPKAKHVLKAAEMQTGKRVVFANIPPHLQARGKGRCLKLYPLSKAEKIENQLK